MEVRRVLPSAELHVFQEMAHIHISEIEEGFLSSLGETFLQVLYRGLARSRRAFCFAAYEEERVVGFIVGSEDTAKVYVGFVLRHGLSAAWALLPRVFSFGVVKRVVETLFYPTKKVEVELPAAEILNFCVSRTMQGLGIGTRLFAELVNEFARRRVTEIRIVTGESQDTAHQFYESRNARRVADFEVHKGTGSVVYLYDIAMEGCQLL